MRLAAGLLRLPAGKLQNVWRSQTRSCAPSARNGVHALPGSKPFCATPLIRRAGGETRCARAGVCCSRGGWWSRPTAGYPYPPTDCELSSYGTVLLS
eukprot:1237880-Rhodomonas_salina.1